MIEPRDIGDSCSNIACTPRKKHHPQSKVGELIEHALEFGAATSADLCVFMNDSQAAVSHVGAARHTDPNLTCDRRLISEYLDPVLCGYQSSDVEGFFVGQFEGPELTLVATLM